MTESLVRTDSKDQDFISLVRLLDHYLSVIDGSDHTFYSQYNGIENLNHVVLLLDEGRPVGCGAIKEFNASCMEVKRMFVAPESRGKGVAKKILHELELWARELGYSKCVLETGKRMQDAVSLYKKCGYKIIPNFEPYTTMYNSICFEKLIS